MPLNIAKGSHVAGCKAHPQAVPVNRWLIAKGKGHAVVMDVHSGHD